MIEVARRSSTVGQGCGVGVGIKESELGKMFDYGVGVRIGIFEELMVGVGVKSRNFQESRSRILVGSFKNLRVGVGDRIEWLIFKIFAVRVGIHVDLIPLGVAACTPAHVSGFFHFSPL